MNVELVQYEIFAKEILKRVMAEEEPADLHEWMRSKLAHIGGGDETAGLDWVESFDWYDALLAKREALALLPFSSCAIARAVVLESPSRTPTLRNRI